MKKAQQPLRYTILNPGKPETWETVLADILVRRCLALRNQP